MSANQFDNNGDGERDFALDSLAAARLFFMLLTGLALLSLPRLFERGEHSGQFTGSYSLQWVILLGINGALACAGLVVLVLLFTRFSNRLLDRSRALFYGISRLGYANIFGCLLFWVVFVLLVLWRYEKHYHDFLPRVWLFWLAVGLGSVFLAAAWKKPLHPAAALLVVSILYGVGIKILGYFPEVSSFPFSLSWSEASRYYYASLPYAQRLYGMDVPLSSLHPTRYFLLGLPFIFDSTSIWLHRFWQVILWVGLSFLSGWALARRLKLSWAAGGIAALWAFLFLLQGPVYYHLLVCLILVLWGFDRNAFWKTLLVVVLASAWAGISRVNWIPVPAMLAISLYLIERPFCSAIPGRKGWLDYLWQPVVWGIAALLAALASQAVYVLFSGHEDASAFSTSFTSALLWYRLLPSPTYPLGVLPASLLVSAPLLVLLFVNWMRYKAHWHTLRVLGLSAMLIVLFIGGLVVSTKIGGGSNLHNMDAFFSLLLVVGVLVGLGQFASEMADPSVPGPARSWRPWPLLFLIVMVPVIWNLDIGDPFVRRDFEQANFDLDKLDKIVQSYASRGEILFITQRQLEVYRLTPGQKLVPEYELMTLTEMAISNNRPYLDQFAADLRNHRFALIISDQPQQFLKNPAVDAFAEENNAWVINVSKPLLQYYQSELFFDTQGIDLLVPKKP